MNPLALILPLLVAAPAGERLREAIALYDAGEVVKAQAALTPLADDSSLTADERGRARLYLAAAHFAANDTTGSAAQLSVLAREHPAVRPDPAVFPPNFVAYFVDVRSKIAQRTALAPGDRKFEAAQAGLPLRPLGIGLAAAGAIAVAAGGGFDGLAYQRYQAQRRAADAADRPAFELARAEAKQFGVIANVLYVAGALVGAGGGTLVWLAPRGPQAVRVSGTPLPAGGALLFEGALP